MVCGGLGWSRTGCTRDGWAQWAGGVVVVVVGGLVVVVCGDIGSAVARSRGRPVSPAAPLGLETLAAGTATAQQIQEFTAPASARAVLVQNPSETHASHADTGHGTRDTGDETRPETGRIRIN